MKSVKISIFIFFTLRVGFSWHVIIRGGRKEDLSIKSINATLLIATMDTSNTTEASSVNEQFTQFIVTVLIFG